MTPEQLKASILQYAVQGKLVEQRPEEGTAEELYHKIQEKKLKLIKEGKIKKEKSLAEISEDEIPFEIPASWKWDRLGNLLIIERGGSPRPIKEFITTDVNGINWIKIGDSEKGSKYINSCAEKIIPEGMKKSRYVEKGDFILSNSMSFGRPYILNIDGCIHDGWLALRQPVPVFDNDYLYYLLSSSMVFYQFCGRVAGAVVNNLNSDKVALTVVPIPPLDEQKRIAKKIEELLPHVERYSEAYEKLEQFNAKFPEDMKKSILQYAIMGKLVEQRPEEGTAEELYQQIQEEKQRLIKEGKIKKEKPLGDITEDEIPFDIPESWKWVKFNTLCAVLTCGYASTPTYVSESEGMPFISAKNVKPYRFMPEDHKYIGKELYEQLTINAKPSKGDILLTRVGAGIGEAAIIDVDMEFAIYVSLTLIKLVNNTLISNRYILHWLNSPLGTATAQKNIFGKGASQGNLNVKNVRDFIVPLPPYEEQIRIADKLDELLPYCDKLSK